MLVLRLDLMGGQDTLVCPGCGEPADPADALCPDCHFHHLGRLRIVAADRGKPVSEERDAGEGSGQPAQADQEGGCPECGEPIDRDVNACGRCGHLHMARLDLAASGGAPGRAQQPFTYVCQDPTCGVTNTIYSDEQNICRNCGQELWLGREAREARWYEEHGRSLEDSEGIEFAVGLFLCAVALLGLGMVVSYLTKQKIGQRDREQGERMNREAGRPLLARSDRRFGGLSGGEYQVNLGPDPEDRPDDYDPEVPRWRVIFTRYYFRGWLVTVPPAFIVLVVLSN